MSEHQQIPTESSSTDRDVLVFRIGSTWCACLPEVVQKVRRVVPQLLVSISDSVECIVTGDGQQIPLCPRPASLGNPLDAPTSAQRWIIFNHDGTHHGVQVDEIVGISPYELDDDERPILRVQDEQGISHTLVLRMDIPGILLEAAA